MDYCYPQLYPWIHNDLKILRDLVQKLADNHSLMLRQFDNLQNSMSACSLKINEAQACFDVPASLEDKGYEKEFADSTTDSTLVDCNSSPMDNSDVLTERFEIPVHDSLHSLPFASLEVSICCTETVDTPLDTKTVVEENSLGETTKVFDNSPQQGTPSLLSVVSHFRPYRSNDLPYTGSRYSRRLPGVSATNTDLDIVRFNTWMDLSLKFDKLESAPYSLYHLLETNGLSRCSVIPRHVLAHCVLIRFPFDPGSFKLSAICHLVSNHMSLGGLVAKLYVCEYISGVAICIASSWDEVLEFVNKFARGGTHGAYEIGSVNLSNILLWEVDSGLRYIDKYFYSKVPTSSYQYFLTQYSFNPSASIFLVTHGGQTLALGVWDPGIHMRSIADPWFSMPKYYVLAEYEICSTFANEIVGVLLKEVKGVVAANLQVELWLVVTRLIKAEQIKLIIRILLQIFSFQFLPKSYHNISLMGRMLQVAHHSCSIICWMLGLDLITSFIASQVPGVYWFVLSRQRVASCQGQHCEKYYSCNTKVFLHVVMVKKQQMQFGCRVPMPHIPYPMALSLHKPVVVLKFSDHVFYESITRSWLAWLYPNLEDKVFIEGGGIVMNPTIDLGGQIRGLGPQTNLRQNKRVEQPNNMSNFVWDTG